jgi:hypothetical protein
LVPAVASDRLLCVEDSLKGEQAYQLLRGVGLAVRARGDLSEDDLVLMLRQALGTAPLTPAQRSKRYRDEEKRKRDEASRQHVTERDDKAPTAATGPVPPLHSPSDPDPEISKDFVVVSEGPDRSERAANAPGATTPTDFESAMRETTAARASHALQDQTVAKRCRVNDWPEIVGILEAWRVAREYPSPMRLRPHGEDPEVKALLVLLAMGYEPDELERMARHLATHPGFKDRALLRAAMTPDAVRIGLDELQRQRKPEPRRRAPAAPTRVVELDMTLEEQRAAADAAAATLRAAGARR